MTKPTLLLLHGALGASTQFAPLIPLLEDTYDLHLLDFEGHGHAPLQSRPFRIHHFAQNVRHFLANLDIQSTHIFGYSMGGYVGITLALTHPHLVQSIATLGTKFHWDEDTARRETSFLDPAKIEAKVPHFAQALAERHTAAGWHTVVTHTADLLWSLAPTGGLRPPTLANLQHPVRIIVGDRDTTVGVPEAHDTYRALPNAQLQVLPATRHELEKVSPTHLASSLTDFFI